MTKKMFSAAVRDVELNEDFNATLMINVIPFD